MVVLPPQVADALIADARSQLPNEACGLLALRHGELTDFTPSRNAEPSPYYYRIAPEDALRVIEIEDAGEQVVIYHSHTTSPAAPSRTDVELAKSWPDALYVIVSLASDPPEITAWTLAPAVQRVELTRA